MGDGELVSAAACRGGVGYRTCVLEMRKRKRNSREKIEKKEGG